MVKELLPPENFIKMLKERLSQLKYTLAYKKKTQAERPPLGHLRIAQVSNKPQYYHCTKENPEKGKFIPRAQEALARQLAQKDYDLKIQKLLEKEIRATERYLSQVTSKAPHKTYVTSDKTQVRRQAQNKIEALYAKMSPARQILISPVTLSDQEYAATWLKTSYHGLSFKTDSPEYYTQKGERVRSKSEVAIANALAQYNIPYRYEYPLTLEHTTASGRKEAITVHPDFLCLNVHTRTEIYWEHFGLMDSSDYSQNVVSKLNLYAENKIFAGHKLIFTMESQMAPLTSKVIELIIEEFLL